MKWFILPVLFCFIGFAGCTEKPVSEEPVSEKPVSIIASGTEKSTYLGSRLFDWCLYDDGVLTVDGITMPDYRVRMSSLGGGTTGYGDAPWYYNEKYRTGITSVIIGEGVAAIGRYAFDECVNLASLSISHTVSEISEESFTGCRKIERIVNYCKTPQMIGSKQFGDTDKSSCTLYVPAGSEDKYRSAAGWSEFENIRQIQ
jgi:hypothetical protein